MNLKKALALTGLLIMACSQGFTQLNFQQTIVDHYELDYKYTSMVRLEDDNGKLDGYVIAGTRFNRQPTSNVSDCVIITIDTEGNLIRDLVFDSYDEEVCLDLTMGTENQVVFTGYVIKDDQKRIFITEVFPISGDVISSQLINLEDDQSAMGMTIEYDSSVKEYVLGGITMKEPKDINGTAQGFIMKLNDEIIPMWTRKFVGPSESGLTAANKVLITPQRNIFVTGTFKVNDSQQGMTALMFDADGTPLWDLSHNSSNSVHMGIDVIYEPSNYGTLYLVSNVSSAHSFLVTTIIKADYPVAAISNQYLVNINTSPINSEPIALGIEFSQENPDNIIVMGKYRSASYNTTSNQSPHFLLEFDKINPKFGLVHLFKVASQGYTGSHDEFLSPFHGINADCMYSGSSFVKNDYDGYSFLGDRLMDYGAWNIEVFNTDNKKSIKNDCHSTFKPLGYNFLSGTNQYDLSISDLEAFKDEFTPKYIDLETSTEYLCPSGGEQSPAFVSNPTTEELSEITFNIYPNPIQSGSFTVQLNGFKTLKSIEVYNAYGAIVMQTSITNNSLQVDASLYSKGIYLVKVTDGTNQKIEKITIQ